MKNHLQTYKILLYSCWLLLLAACATNPVTGKRELQIISESQEIHIGRDNYIPTQQVQGGSWTLDADLSAYVSRVGRELAKFSDRPGLPYEFVVLDSSVPNAWALPGGKIAVNRGLLVTLNNEAELAAVLGHEITHAAARHSAKALERNLLLQTTLIGLAITIDQDDVRNLLVGAGLLGTQLISQKYSRDAELEADLHGMRYLAGAGYDPAAAISLQETFVKLAAGRKQDWLSGLFSSHPPSQERVKANRKTASALKSAGNLNAGEYQRQIAALKKLQPQLDQLDQAQAALNKQQLDQAASLAEQVSRTQPALARAWGIRGAVLLQQKQYQQAVSMFDQAIKRDNGYFQYHLLRGLCHKSLDNREQAQQDLNTSLTLLPTAVAHNALGEIALANGNSQQAQEHFRIAAGSDSQAGQQARARLQPPQPAR